MDLKLKNEIISQLAASANYIRDQAERGMSQSANGLHRWADQISATLDRVRQINTVN